MNRFVFRKQCLSALSVSVLLANVLMVSAPPAAAAAEWMDVLKPLVKDVIIPGAQLGVKKWVEKRKAQEGSTTEVQTITIPDDQVVQTTSSDPTLPTPERPATSTPQMITIPDEPPPPVVTP